MSMQLTAQPASPRHTFARNGAKVLEMIFLAIPVISIIVIMLTKELALIIKIISFE